MNLATLVVKIVGDINDYAESLRKSQQATDSFSNRALDGLSKIGGAVVVGGLTAVATATLAIGAAGWNAAETMDKAYDIIQTQTGATGETLKTLQGDFDNVFANAPTDAQQAADVISGLNQKLGITGPTLDEASIKLLNMTNLLGGDAKTNAELFGRTMQDAGLPVDQAGTLLDKLFVASQKSGIGVDSLMQKMVQFGAPMRNMGFDLDTSIALFAKWEKEGVNAELVMGSLRIAAGNFAKEGKPLNEGLAETIEKIKGAKDASEALVIAQGVFGARAAGDMAAAIREGRFDIEDMTAALQGSDGAINKTTASTQDWNEKWVKFTNFLTLSLAPMGQTLRDIAGDAMDMLQAFVSKPEVQTFIQDVSDKVAGLGSTIREWLPQVAEWFRQGWAWLMDHKEFIVAALAILTVAIVAWAVTSAIAIAPLIVEMLPVIAVMLLIGVVAGVLYLAWTQNWGGIQEKTAAVWAWLQPVFQSIQNWFAINIPIAIRVLTGFWNTVLWPALKSGWDWLMMKLRELGAWLQVNIPLALKALSDVWTGTLWPAIRNVWNWLSTVLFPFFTAFTRALTSEFALGLRSIAAIFENVLLPAFKAVVGYLGLHMDPAFANFLRGVNIGFMGSLKGLANFLSTVLKQAFEGITMALQDMTKGLNDLSTGLDTLKLPDWLTPGSPTPWEIGLDGINREMALLAGSNLPDFNSGLQIQQAAVGAGGQGTISLPKLSAGIKPKAEAGSGAGVVININVDHHPLVSGSDERELAAKLGPAILAVLKQYKVSLNN